MITNNLLNSLLNNVHSSSGTLGQLIANKNEALDAAILEQDTFSPSSPFSDMPGTQLKLLNFSEYYYATDIQIDSLVSQNTVNHELVDGYLKGSVQSISEEERSVLADFFSHVLANADAALLQLTPAEQSKIYECMETVCIESPGITSSDQEAKEAMLKQLGISSQEQQFRDQAYLFDYDNEIVNAFVESLTEEGVIGELDNEFDVVSKVLSYMQENFDYNKEAKGTDKWQSIEETLLEEGGDCEDLAIMQSAVLSNIFKNKFGYSKQDISSMISLTAGHLITPGKNVVGHAMTKITLKQEDGQLVDFYLDSTSKTGVIPADSITFKELFSMNDINFNKTGFIASDFQTNAALSSIFLSDTRTYGISESNPYYDQLFAIAGVSEEVNQAAYEANKDTIAWLLNDMLINVSQRVNGSDLLIPQQYETAMYRILQEDELEDIYIHLKQELGISDDEATTTLNAIATEIQTFLSTFTDYNTSTFEYYNDELTLLAESVTIDGEDQYPDYLSSEGENMIEEHRQDLLSDLKDDDGNVLQGFESVYQKLQDYEYISHGELQGLRKEGTASNLSISDPELYLKFLGYSGAYASYAVLPYRSIGGNGIITKAGIAEVLNLDKSHADVEKVWQNLIDEGIISQKNDLEDWSIITDTLNGKLEDLTGVDYSEMAVIQGYHGDDFQIEGSEDRLDGYVDDDAVIESEEQIGLNKYYKLSSEYWDNPLDDENLFDVKWENIIDGTSLSGSQVRKLFMYDDLNIDYDDFRMHGNYSDLDNNYTETDFFQLFGLGVTFQTQFWSSQSEDADSEIESLNPPEFALENAETSADGTVVEGMLSGIEDYNSVLLLVEQILENYKLLNQLQTNIRTANTADEKQRYIDQYNALEDAIPKLYKFITADMLIQSEYTDDSQEQKRYYSTITQEYKDQFGNVYTKEYETPYSFLEVHTTDIQGTNPSDGGEFGGFDASSFDSAGDATFVAQAMVMNSDALFNWTYSIRKSLNQFEMMFHLVNEAMEFMKDQARELHDRYMDDETKRAVDKIRKTADKMPNKIAKMFGQFQQDMNSGVDNITGQIVDFINNSNETIFSKKNLDVDGWAETVVAEDDVASFVGSMVLGGATGVIDGFTGAFTYVRSRMKHNLAEFQAKISAANAIQGNNFFALNLLGELVEENGTQYRKGGIRLWKGKPTKESDLSEGQDHYQSYYGETVTNILAASIFENEAQQAVSKHFIESYINRIGPTQGLNQTADDANIDGSTELGYLYSVIAQGQQYEETLESISRDNLERSYGYNESELQDSPLFHKDWGGTTSWQGSAVAGGVDTDDLYEQMGIDPNDVPETDEGIAELLGDAENSGSDQADADTESFADAPLYLDYDYEKQAEFRYRMYRFQTAVSTALTVYQLIADKKLEEAKSFGESLGIKPTSSGQAARKAASNSLSAELSQLRGSFQKMHSFSATALKSANNLLEARINLARDRSLMILQSTMTAIQAVTAITIRAVSIVSGISIASGLPFTGALAGQGMIDPTYWVTAISGVINAGLELITQASKTAIIKGAIMYRNPVTLFQDTTLGLREENMSMTTSPYNEAYIKNALDQINANLGLYPSLSTYAPAADEQDEIARAMKTGPSILTYMGQYFKNEYDRDLLETRQFYAGEMDSFTYTTTTDNEINIAKSDFVSGAPGITDFGNTGSFLANQGQGSIINNGLYSSLITQISKTQLLQIELSVITVKMIVEAYEQIVEDMFNYKKPKSASSLAESSAFDTIQGILDIEDQLLSDYKAEVSTISEAWNHAYQQDKRYFSEGIENAELSVSLIMEFMPFIMGWGIGTAGQSAVEVTFEALMEGIKEGLPYADIQSKYHNDDKIEDREDALAMIADESWATGIDFISDAQSSSLSAARESQMDENLRLDMIWDILQYKPFAQDNMSSVVARYSSIVDDIQRQRLDPTHNASYGRSDEVTGMFDILGEMETSIFDSLFSGELDASRNPTNTYYRLSGDKRDPVIDTANVSDLADHEKYLYGVTDISTSNSDTLEDTNFYMVHMSTVMETQEQLTKVFTMRMVLLMFEQAIYQQKQQELQQIVGFSVNAGVLSSAMKVVDKYNTMQLDVFSSITDELTSRVESQNTYAGGAVNIIINQVANAIMIPLLTNQYTEAANPLDSKKLRKATKKAIEGGTIKSVVQTIAGFVYALTLFIGTSMRMEELDAEFVDDDDSDDEDEESDETNSDSLGTVKNPDEKAQEMLESSNTDEKSLNKSMADLKPSSAVKYTSRGGFVANKALLSKIQAATTKKFRKLQLLMKLQDKANDARQEAAAEITGLQPSGARGMLNSIMGQFQKSEMAKLQQAHQGAESLAKMQNQHIQSIRQTVVEAVKNAMDLFSKNEKKKKEKNREKKTGQKDKSKAQNKTDDSKQAGESKKNEEAGKAKEKKKREGTKTDETEADVAEDPKKAEAAQKQKKAREGDTDAVDPAGDEDPAEAAAKKKRRDAREKRNLVLGKIFRFILDLPGALMELMETNSSKTKPASKKKSKAAKGAASGAGDKGADTSELEKAKEKGKKKKRGAAEDIEEEERQRKEAAKEKFSDMLTDIWQTIGTVMLVDALEYLGTTAAGRDDGGLWDAEGDVEGTDGIGAEAFETGGDSNPTFSGGAVGSDFLATDQLENAILWAKVEANNMAVRRANLQDQKEANRTLGKTLKKYMDPRQMAKMKPSDDPLVQDKMNAALKGADSQIMKALRRSVGGDATKVDKFMELITSKENIGNNLSFEDFSNKFGVEEANRFVTQLTNEGKNEGSARMFDVKLTGAEEKQIKKVGKTTTGDSKAAKAAMDKERQRLINEKKFKIVKNRILKNAPFLRAGDFMNQPGGIQETGGWEDFLRAYSKFAAILMMAIGKADITEKFKEADDLVSGKNDPNKPRNFQDPMGKGNDQQRLERLRKLGVDSKEEGKSAFQDHLNKQFDHKGLKAFEANLNSFKAKSPEDRALVASVQKMVSERIADLNPRSLKDAQKRYKKERKEEFQKGLQEFQLTEMQREANIFKRSMNLFIKREGLDFESTLEHRGSNKNDFRYENVFDAARDKILEHTGFDPSPAALQDEAVMELEKHKHFMKKRDEYMNFHGGKFQAGLIKKLKDAHGPESKNIPNDPKEARKVFKGFGKNSKDIRKELDMLFGFNDSQISDEEVAELQRIRDKVKQIKELGGAYLSQDSLADKTGGGGKRTVLQQINMVQALTRATIGADEDEARKVKAALSRADHKFIKKADDQEKRNVRIEALMAEDIDDMEGEDKKQIVMSIAKATRGDRKLDKREVAHYTARLIEQGIDKDKAEDKLKAILSKVGDKATREAAGNLIDRHTKGSEVPSLDHLQLRATIEAYRKLEEQFFPDEAEKRKVEGRPDQGTDDVEGGKEGSAAKEAMDAFHVELSTDKDLEEQLKDQGITLEELKKRKPELLKQFQDAKAEFDREKGLYDDAIKKAEAEDVAIASMNDVKQKAVAARKKRQEEFAKELDGMTASDPASLKGVSDRIDGMSSDDQAIAKSQLAVKLNDAITKDYKNLDNVQLQAMADASGNATVKENVEKIIKRRADDAAKAAIRQAALDAKVAREALHRQNLLGLARENNVAGVNDNANSDAIVAAIKKHVEDKKREAIAKNKASDDAFKSRAQELLEKVGKTYKEGMDAAAVNAALKAAHGKDLTVAEAGAERRYQKEIIEQAEKAGVSSDILAHVQSQNLSGEEMKAQLKEHVANVNRSADAINAKTAASQTKFKARAKELLEKVGKTYKEGMDAAAVNAELKEAHGKELAAEEIRTDGEYKGKLIKAAEKAGVDAGLLADLEAQNLSGEALKERLKEHVASVNQAAAAINEKTAKSKTEFEAKAKQLLGDDYKEGMDAAAVNAKLKAKHGKELAAEEIRTDGEYKGKLIKAAEKAGVDAGLLADLEAQNLGGEALKERLKEHVANVNRSAAEINAKTAANKAAFEVEAQKSLKAAGAEGKYRPGMSADEVNAILKDQYNQAVATEDGQYKDTLLQQAEDSELSKDAINRIKGQNLSGAKLKQALQQAVKEQNEANSSAANAFNTAEEERYDKELRAEARRLGVDESLSQEEIIRELKETHAKNVADTKETEAYNAREEQRFATETATFKQASKEYKEKMAEYEKAKGPELTKEQARELVNFGRGRGKRYDAAVIAKLDKIASLSFEQKKQLGNHLNDDQLMDLRHKMGKHNKRGDFGGIFSIASLDKNLSPYSNASVEGRERLGNVKQFTLNTLRDFNMLHEDEDTGKEYLLQRNEERTLQSLFLDQNESSKDARNLVRASIKERFHNDSISIKKYNKALRTFFKAGMYAVKSNEDKKLVIDALKHTFKLKSDRQLLNQGSMDSPTKGKETSGINLQRQLNIDDVSKIVDVLGNEHFSDGYQSRFYSNTNARAAINHRQGLRQSDIVKRPQRPEAPIAPKSPDRRETKDAQLFMPKDKDHRDATEISLDLQDQGPSKARLEQVDGYEDNRADTIALDLGKIQKGPITDRGPETIEGPDTATAKGITLDLAKIQKGPVTDRGPETIEGPDTATAKGITLELGKIQKGPIQSVGLEQVEGPEHVDPEDVNIHIPTPPPTSPEDPPTAAPVPDLGIKLGAVAGRQFTPLKADLERPVQRNIQGPKAQKLVGDDPAREAVKKVRRDPGGRLDQGTKPDDTLKKIQEILGKDRDGLDKLVTIAKGTRGKSFKDLLHEAKEGKGNTKYLEKVNALEDEEDAERHARSMKTAETGGGRLFGGRQIETLNTFSKARDIIGNLSGVLGFTRIMFGLADANIKQRPTSRIEHFFRHNEDAAADTQSKMYEDPKVKDYLMESFSDDTVRQMLKQKRRYHDDNATATKRKDAVEKMVYDRILPLLQTDPSGELAKDQLSAITSPTKANGKAKKPEEMEASQELFEHAVALLYDIDSSRTNNVHDFLKDKLLGSTSGEQQGRIKDVYDRVENGEIDDLTIGTDIGMYRGEGGQGPMDHLRKITKISDKDIVESNKEAQHDPSAAPLHNMNRYISALQNGNDESKTMARIITGAASPAEKSTFMKSAALGVRDDINMAARKYQLSKGQNPDENSVLKTIVKETKQLNDPAKNQQDEERQKREAELRNAVVGEKEPKSAAEFGDKFADALGKESTTIEGISNARSTIEAFKGRRDSHLIHDIVHEIDSDTAKQISANLAEIIDRQEADRRVDVVELSGDAAAGDESNPESSRSLGRFHDDFVDFKEQLDDAIRRQDEEQQAILDQLEHLNAVLNKSEAEALSSFFKDQENMKDVEALVDSGLRVKHKETEVAVARIVRTMDDKMRQLAQYDESIQDRADRFLETIVEKDIQRAREEEGQRVDETKEIETRFRERLDETRSRRDEEIDERVKKAYSVGAYAPMDSAIRSLEGPRQSITAAKIKFDTGNPAKAFDQVKRVSTPEKVKELANELGLSTITTVDGNSKAATVQRVVRAMVAHIKGPDAPLQKMDAKSLENLGNFFLGISDALMNNPNISKEGLESLAQMHRDSIDGFNLTQAALGDVAHSTQGGTAVTDLGKHLNGSEMKQFKDIQKEGSRLSLTKGEAKISADAAFGRLEKSLDQSKQLNSILNQLEGLDGNTAVRDLPPKTLSALRQNAMFASLDISKRTATGRIQLKNLISMTRDEKAEKDVEFVDISRSIKIDEQKRKEEAIAFLQGVQEQAGDTVKRSAIQNAINQLEQELGDIESQLSTQIANTASLFPKEVQQQRLSNERARVGVALQDMFQRHAGYVTRYLNSSLSDRDNLKKFKGVSEKIIERLPLTKQGPAKKMLNNYILLQAKLNGDEEMASTALLDNAYSDMEFVHAMNNMSVFEQNGVQKLDNALRIKQDDTAMERKDKLYAAGRVVVALTNKKQHLEQKLGLTKDQRQQMKAALRQNAIHLMTSHAEIENTAIWGGMKEAMPSLGKQGNSLQSALKAIIAKSDSNSGSGDPVGDLKELCAKDKLDASSTLRLEMYLRGMLDDSKVIIGSDGKPVKSAKEAKAKSSIRKSKQKARTKGKALGKEKQAEDNLKQDFLRELNSFSYQEKLTLSKLGLGGLLDWRSAFEPGKRALKGIADQIKSSMSGMPDVDLEREKLIDAYRRQTEANVELVTNKAQELKLSLSEDMHERGIEAAEALTGGGENPIPAEDKERANKLYNNISLLNKDTGSAKELMAKIVQLDKDISAADESGNTLSDQTQKVARTYLTAVFLGKHDFAESLREIAIKGTATFQESRAQHTGNAPLLREEQELLGDVSYLSHKIAVRQGFAEQLDVKGLSLLSNSSKEEKVDALAYLYRQDKSLRQHLENGGNVAHISNFSKQFSFVETLKQLKVQLRGESKQRSFRNVLLDLKHAISTDQGSPFMDKVGVERAAMTSVLNQLIQDEGDMALNEAKKADEDNGIDLGRMEEASKALLNETAKKTMNRSQFSAEVKKIAAAINTLNYDHSFEGSVDINIDTLNQSVQATGIDPQRQLEQQAKLLNQLDRSGLFKVPKSIHNNLQKALANLGRANSSTVIADQDMSLAVDTFKSQVDHLSNTDIDEAIILSDSLNYMDESDFAPGEYNDYKETLEAIIGGLERPLGASQRQHAKKMQRDEQLQAALSDISQGKGDASFSYSSLIKSSDDQVRITNQLLAGLNSQSRRSEASKNMIRHLFADNDRSGERNIDVLQRHATTAKGRANMKALYDALTYTVKFAATGDEGLTEADMDVVDWMHENKNRLSEATGSSIRDIDDTLRLAHKHDKSGIMQKGIFHSDNRGKSGKMRHRLFVANLESGGSTLETAARDVGKLNKAISNYLQNSKGRAEMDLMADCLASVFDKHSVLDMLRQEAKNDPQTYRYEKKKKFADLIEMKEMAPLLKQDLIENKGHLLKRVLKKGVMFGKGRMNDRLIDAMADTLRRGTAEEKAQMQDGILHMVQSVITSEASPQERKNVTDFMEALLEGVESMNIKAKNTFKSDSDFIKKYRNIFTANSSRPRIDAGVFEHQFEAAIPKRISSDKKARRLFKRLISKGYLNEDGSVTEKFRKVEAGKTKKIAKAIKDFDLGDVDETEKAIIFNIVNDSLNKQENLDKPIELSFNDKTELKKKGILDSTGLPQLSPIQLEAQKDALKKERSAILKSNPEMEAFIDDEIAAVDEQLAEINKLAPEVGDKLNKNFLQNVDYIQQQLGLTPHSARELTIVLKNNGVLTQGRISGDLDEISGFGVMVDSFGNEKNEEEIKAQLEKLAKVSKQNIEYMADQALSAPESFTAKEFTRLSRDAYFIDEQVKRNPQMQRDFYNAVALKTDVSAPAMKKKFMQSLRKLDDERLAELLSDANLHPSVRSLLVELKLEKEAQPADGKFAVDQSKFNDFVIKMSKGHRSVYQNALQAIKGTLNQEKIARYLDPHLPPDQEIAESTIPNKDKRADAYAERGNPLERAYEANKDDSRIAGPLLQEKSLIKNADIQRVLKRFSGARIANEEDVAQVFGMLVTSGIDATDIIQILKEMDKRNIGPKDQKGERINLSNALKSGIKKLTTTKEKEDKTKVIPDTKSIGTYLLAGNITAQRKARKVPGQDVPPMSVRDFQNAMSKTQHQMTLMGLSKAERKLSHDKKLSSIYSNVKRQLVGQVSERAQRFGREALSSGDPNKLIQFFKEIEKTA